MVSNIPRKWKQLAIIVGVAVLFVLALQMLIIFGRPLTRLSLEIFLTTSTAKQHVSFLMQPQNGCSSAQFERLQLVVVVISEFSGTSRRQIIRQTWGNLDQQQKYNFRLFYLVGMKKKTDSVLNENLLHGDMIQVDLQEDYYKLTEKTMAALGWADEFCPNARYVFKCDDDVFLNIRRLMPRLHRHKPSEKFIMGKCVTTEPFRFTTKWALTYAEYPFDKFPVYCAGPGYLLSMAAVKDLYTAMLKSQIFKLEDVFVGMVAYTRNVSLECNYHFLYDVDEISFESIMFYIYQLCTIVHHRTSTVEMKKFWQEYSSTVYTSDPYYC